MFITIKPKPIIACLLIICTSIIITIYLFTITKASGESRFAYTIVIDAGHGGRDNGCSGINTNVKESELNLEVTKILKNYLSNFGFNVILTRTTPDGLYSPNATNFKKDDMAKREEIIKKSNANMLISIHMNSFPSPAERGAQAFYDANNEDGKLLANEIQKQLILDLPYARKECNKGDYYLLKCVDIPTAIIECGFITNPEEELLLQQSDYQQKVAYSIFSGIIRYIISTSNINIMD